MTDKDVRKKDREVRAKIKPGFLAIPSDQAKPIRGGRSGRKTIRNDRGNGGNMARNSISGTPNQISGTGEEFYRFLFDAISQGVLVHDPQGRIIQANPAACEILGMSREQILGKTTGGAGITFTHEDGSPVPADEMPAQMASRTGKGIANMLLGIRPPGKADCRWVLASSVPRFEAGKQKPREIMTTFIDISGQKLVENELRESRSRLEAAEQLAQIGSSSWDVDGDRTTWSQEMYLITGWNPDQPGPTHSQRAALYSPESWERMQIAIQKALTSGEPYSLEVEIVRPDGTRRQAFAQGEPVRDQEGRVVRLTGTLQDVTDHKREAETLLASEEKFRGFIEQSLEGFILLDEQGIIIEWNHAQEVITGLGRERVLGRPGWEVQSGLVSMGGVDPTSLERNKSGLAEALRTGNSPIFSRPLEAHILRPDGEVRFIRQSSFPIRTARGYRIGSVISDFTERKRAEDALRDREHQMQALVTSLDDIVFEFDEQGTYLNVWTADETLLVEPKTQLLGRKVVETLGNEPGLKLEQAVKRVLKTGIAEEIEYPLEVMGGNRWFLARINPIIGRGEGRKTASMLIRDITAHRQAQEALSENELRFRALIENSADAIALIDAHGTILFESSAATRILGFQPDEMVGHTAFEFLHPDDVKATAGLFGSLQQTPGGIVKNEIRYRCKDNSYRWVEATGKNLLDYASVKAIVVNYHDITSRKQAEEALAQRNEELGRLYRASGSLISSSPADLHSLAETIVQVVLKEFGQANCSLFLVPTGSNELERIAVAGPFASEVSKSRLTLDGPGLVPQVVRTGEGINALDVQAIPAYLPGWKQTRAELAIPLKIGSSVIGVIDVQSATPQAFTADDERLMLIFAERAALALEHARLYVQTENRMQNMISLRTIDTAISSSFDIKFTLGILLNQVTRQPGIQAADVLVFDPASQSFQVAATQGLSSMKPGHPGLRLGDSLAGRVARERRPVTIQDLTSSRVDSQRTAELLRDGFVAYLGVPLIAKGQVKGVLEVFQHERFSLDQERRSFLEMLAGQAALAIDGAQLFENLQNSNAELMMAYDETIEGWSHAMDLRDEETEGHSRRVTELTVKLAGIMGCSPVELVHIRRGALLHDIGKLGVPDHVLNKAGPLSEEEWEIMRRHPKLAYDMLAPITYLHAALDIPYCHHEKWDGNGYPRGLRESEIPLAARIFAIVDVWDALTSDRPYRQAWTREKALAHIREQAGKHFDPIVVDLFLREVS